MPRSSAGTQKTVCALKQAKVRFITAAHVTEIESYTNKVPTSAFTDVVLDSSDDSYEQDIERVAEAARIAGFEQIHERLFAIELGVDVPVSEQVSKDASPKRRRGPRSKAAKHLVQAQRLIQQMAADEGFGRQEAAASLGISVEHLDNQLALLRLAPEVQARILEWGERFPFGEARLRKLLKLAPEVSTSERGTPYTRERAARARCPRPAGAVATGAVEVITTTPPRNPGFARPEIR